MLHLEETIKSLYPINLIEGEGLGTAYEYFVKLKKLEKFINSIGHPESILIAGLPERYGLSMDFFLLGHMLKAEVVVWDERAEVLSKAQEVIKILEKKHIFQDPKILFLNKNLSEKIDVKKKGGNRFDLALSSEVFQRLNSGQEIYISNLMSLAGNFALFAPNQQNDSHAKISGLKGTKLEELLSSCKQGNPGLQIFDHGFLDLPPFPPGISRSEEKRTKAAQSRVESILMKGLQLYGRFENLLPKSIKRKTAHIVFVMGKNCQLQECKCETG